MQDELKITLIQTSLHWENVAANRNHFEKLIGKAGASDVIVLPEMFSTGFSMQVKTLAEEMDGETITWIKKMASQTNAVLTGSLIIREDHLYYNRLFWCFPHGELLHYDKRHLFRMGMEHEHYSAGDQKIFPEWKGWRICPLVCYDLRFPVWSRNVAPFHDVLIYVANWPEVRRHPWRTLLTARAMENQCYVVGLNRVGEDGNGIAHSGDSGVIDPKGEWISTVPAHEESVSTIRIRKSELTEFRQKFPVLLDGDEFKILE